MLWELGTDDTDEFTTAITMPGGGWETTFLVSASSGRDRMVQPCVVALLVASTNFGQTNAR